MTARLIGVVYAPFALGFFLSYMSRSINAVIAGDLARDASLSAADLGMLTAAFFVAVASMQLPVGIMLDRYGPRRVQSILLLIAAGGAAIFALGQDVATLMVGRFLIGFGFAGGLMASLKAFVLWFPRERLGLANSSLLALGGIGALIATMPADAFAAAFGWRAIFWALAAGTAVAALVIRVVVPEQAASATRQTLRASIAGLLEIYRDPIFLRLAPVSCVVGGSFQAIQSLWAGPWFRDVAGFDRVGVAYGLSIIAVSLIAGHTGMAIVADRLIRRGVEISTIIGVCSAVMIFVQVGLAAGLVQFWFVLWFVFGVLGNVSALGFTAFGQYFAADRVGRANTAMNMFMFLSTFTVQSVIGWIIDFWPETPAGGYDPAGYGAGFGVVVAAEILAYLWFLWSIGRAPK